jgi:hypothetical protein
MGFNMDRAKNANGPPMCHIPLCGGDAEWRVELFERVEYYCNRHRPGLPETLMTKVNPS